MKSPSLVVKSIFAILVVLVATSGHARPRVLIPPIVLPLKSWTAQVNRVVDADTFDVEIELGFDVLVRTRLRLMDVDAWEIRGVERIRGLEASEFAESWIDRCSDDKGRLELLTNSPPKKGKYGRWIADLTGLTCTRLSVALVQYGHAERVTY